jgi:hypothetical protein
VRAALSQEREKKEGRGGGLALERKEEKWSEKKNRGKEGMKGVLPELGRIMLHLKLVLVALVVDLDRPFSGT